MILTINIEVNSGNYGKAIAASELRLEVEAVDPEQIPVFAQMMGRDVAAKLPVALAKQRAADLSEPRTAPKPPEPSPFD